MKLLPIAPGCLALLKPGQFKRIRNGCVVGTFEVAAMSVTVTERHYNPITPCGYCGASDNKWGISAREFSQFRTVTACECCLTRIDGDPDAETLESERELERCQ